MLPDRDALGKLERDYLSGAIDAESYTRLKNQYTESQGPPPPPGYAQSYPTSSLRPLAGRAVWAVIALVAVILSDLLAVWSDLQEIDLVNRILDGEAVTEDELDDNDYQQFIVALIQLAVLIAAAFFFIRWFHGAYSNLRALGRPDLRFGTGWAIGGWFVPIMHLWRPKQIANDIWRGSAPDDFGPSQDDWKRAPVAPLVHVWWAAWVTASFVGWIVGRLFWSSDTADEIKTAAQGDIAFSVIDIVAAVLAILVVRAMTSRQEERTRQIATMPIAPQPPSQPYP